MIVCAYEDRASALVGLKLMVLSVLDVAPGLTADATTSRELGPGLEAWAVSAGLTDRLRIRTDKGWAGTGWDVKPGKLLEQLDAGHEEVVWIDSDVVAHRDFRPALSGLPAETIVVGQEFRTDQTVGSRLRAEGWGFACRRELPYTTNSGFVRVTPAHRPLLLRWQELLASPSYREAQTRPISERPIQALGDQDVLWSLLGSEFAEVPVRYLKCGDEIIQDSGANGYRVIERLRHVGKGLPMLIHSLGKSKPWNFSEAPSPKQRRAYLDLALLELSPYVAVARRYREALGEPAPWLRPRTALAKALRLLAGGHPSLQGMPLALLAEGLGALGRKPG